MPTMRGRREPARPEPDPRLHFGWHVRSLRRARKLSQEVLADRAGLDRTYISGIERGIRNLSLINICRLAGALGVEPAALFDKVPAIDPE
jgi:transcriptional regulator with XRE-family HTH domain